MSITRINTNPEAMLASTNLKKVEYAMTKTMGRLASGLRINNASDDPSGIGIQMSFEKQFRQTGVMIGNAQNVLGMMQTYDGALSEIGNRLQELNDIAVQASDSSLNQSQKDMLWQAYSAIRSGITTYAQSVKFNDKPIMAGSGPTTATLGPGLIMNFSVAATITTATNAVFGTQFATATSFSTLVLVSAAVKQVASAINVFSKYRTIIGAQTQAVENVIKSMQNTQVNMSATLSRVKDADMSEEIQAFTKQQVLTQTATAMLAQANMQPQGILKLLGV